MDEEDMQSEKSKSNSGKMALKDALKVLGVSKDATIHEINQAFTDKLNRLQTKYAEKPDRLVQEADNLYAAYRTVYSSKDGPEDQVLPLTIQGPDSMLNMFGISDVPHQSLKVQMQSQVHYQDGKMVKKASNKSESFINSDGKREVKIYEDGKLIKHTIDGKDMLK